MKILFLSKHKYPHIGGVERHIQEIGKRIEKLEHSVTTISEEDIKPPHIKYFGLLYIWYWLFKNRKLIEKGKYTLETDPFLIASWIVWPSYISGWATLQYYHLTEQLPFTIQVITTRKRNRKVIQYGNATIEFTRVKPSFLKGYRQVLYQQKELFIAEKEKALVDAVATKKMTLEECNHIIQQNKRPINIKKILSYASTIKGLAKRIKEELHD